jgi:hypothetical protein
MTNRERVWINSYLFDYLKRTYKDQKITDKTTIMCPLGCSDKPTAQILNSIFSCFNPECEGAKDIFDLIRKTKTSCEDWSDDQICDYVKTILGLEFFDDTEELIKIYSKANFCLFPTEPKSKLPQKGFKWADKEYKNPELWRDWVDRGYGLALRLGKVSQVVAIDIDSDETYEKVKHLLGDTLTQTTARGKHFLYAYEDCYDDIRHYNLRNKGYEMEIRANNAYIVVAPTSVNGEIRKWNNNKIKTMPKGLKDLITSLIDKTTKSVDEEIQEAIDNEKLSVVDLSGRRNDTFIETMGVFRKFLPTEKVLKVMTFLSNNWIDKPIPKKELYAMSRQLEKYNTYDKKELSEIVLERLDVTKESSAFQISKTIQYDQKDVEDVLKYLEEQGKVVSVGKNRYQKINDVEWVAGFDNDSIPLDYTVPYFGKYAYFNQGNLIIIGGGTGTGKTHIVANIIKQYYDKKEVDSVDLISTEAGSNIGKILTKLNVPFDFVFKPKNRIRHPTDIELRDNRVTIIDWLKPKDGNYAETDNTFERLHEQLKKHNGLLIVFVQTRRSDNKFFAQDQIDFYSAFSCIFNYKKDGDKIDTDNPYFETVKIRDSKTGRQYITIPLKYNKETKVLEEVE